MDFFWGARPALSTLSALPNLLLKRYRPWSGDGVLESRILYDSDNELLLVDRKGNYYEPYSMAWRYLGMYIDCNDVVDDDRGSGSGSGSGSADGDEGCRRSVLWAAYLDKAYEGGSVGEYQYYSPSTGQWDDSTCMTSRCQKLDCHERDSHFRLLGVFKEIDGMEDFAEQLFKHHGYCLWEGGTGAGKYTFMSNYRQYSFPTGCSEFSTYSEEYDNLYKNWMPLPGGNVTFGLYSDSWCTVGSNYTMAEAKYDRAFNYGYSEDYSEYKAQRYLKKQAKMNKYLDEYKVCQPCRAYSKNRNSEGSGSGDEDEDEDGSGDSGDHMDEGGGSEEQWGFDCNDDAGYLNCNQCYKFETKTRMRAATRSDLKEASSQGTILEIMVDRVVYGSGSYGSSTEWYIDPLLSPPALIALTMFSIVVALASTAAGRKGLTVAGGTCMERAGGILYGLRRRIAVAMGPTEGAGKKYCGGASIEVMYKPPLASVVEDLPVIPTGETGPKQQPGWFQTFHDKYILGRSFETFDDEEVIKSPPDLFPPELFPSELSPPPACSDSNLVPPLSDGTGAVRCLPPPDPPGAALGGPVDPSPGPAQIPDYIEVSLSDESGVVRCPLPQDPPGAALDGPTDPPPGPPLTRNLRPLSPSAGAE